MRTDLKMSQQCRPAPGPPHLNYCTLKLAAEAARIFGSQGAAITMATAEDAASPAGTVRAAPVTTSLASTCWRLFDGGMENADADAAFIAPAQARVSGMVPCGDGDCMPKARQP